MPGMALVSPTIGMFTWANTAQTCRTIVFVDDRHEQTSARLGVVDGA